MSRVLLVLIQAYRYCVSLLLGPNCRFFPSCSDYAAQAIDKYGAGHGSWLALKRIARCHQWHPGGYDPVP